ncbi:5'-adenylylsulfate reductase-like 3, partial [Ananas comosus]
MTLDSVEKSTKEMRLLCKGSESGALEQGGLCAVLFLLLVSFLQNLHAKFQSLSLLFPSIRHFAFEESSSAKHSLKVRSSWLPNTFSLKLHDACAGINPALSHSMPVERIEDLLTGDEVKEDIVQENCPFSWA